MIDKEVELLNLCRNACNEVFGENAIFFLSSYVDRPASFPCVYMEQTNSYPMSNMETQESTENYAVLNYQFDIYSNKTNGRKQECRKIANVIDEMMRKCNFRRTSMIHNYNPSEGTVYTNDVHDENIYRLILRYEGVASETHFYRR